MYVYYLYISSIVFCLTAGVLEIISFLRMYVMAMFLVTAIAYLIISNIEHFSYKQFILIWITTVCGASTHYYHIAFTVFLPSSQSSRKPLMPQEKNLSGKYRIKNKLRHHREYMPFIHTPRW